MDVQTFLLDLVRIRFGFMACFHYIFVPLTLGLITAIGCMEVASVRTGNVAWSRAAHFWFRLFTLSWLVGVVTGYPLRAQLAADWSNYGAYVKPVLDQITPLETAIAPCMLAGVIVLATLGQRLPPIARACVVWALAILMIFQSAAILSVNAWMQHPVAISGAGRFLTAYPFWGLLLNPMTVAKVTHVVSASWVCGGTVLCAISAIYLYRRQHLPVARVSLKTGLLLGVLATPLVLVTGHLSVMEVARDQPMKFAAFEGLWQRESGPAGWVVVAIPQPERQTNRMEVKIPYLMSLLTGHGLSGSPPGIRDVLVGEELRMRQAVRTEPTQTTELQGYRALYAQEQARAGEQESDVERVRRAAARTIPNVRLLFGGFRLMAAVGLLMLVLFLCGFLLRNGLQARRYGKVLLVMPILIPLPWLATFAGWIVAEAGRQPWVVYGYLPTAVGAKLPTLEQGFVGTVLVVSIYLVLGVIFALLSLLWIRQGPLPSDRVDDVRSGAGELVTVTSN